MHKDRKCSRDQSSCTVYGKFLGMFRRANANDMFVSNDIPYFEAFLEYQFNNLLLEYYLPVMICFAE